MENIKNVFISHSGVCYRRELDSNKISSYFESNGCMLVHDLDKANIIVLMTCGYKEEIANAIFNQIETLKQYPAELIVLGCLPGIDPSEFQKKFSGKWLSTKDIDNIGSFFPEFKVKYTDLPDSNFLNETYVKDTASLYNLENQPDNQFIGIIRVGKARMNHQDSDSKIPVIMCCRGCNWKCSYCGIYNAIGRVKSKSLKTVVDEYRKLLSAGYRDIRLTGDEVGNYGTDIQSNFGELLNTLRNVSRDSEIRWYINDIHPRYANEYRELLSKLVREGVLPEMQIMVQSGNNRILEQMNRGYAIESVSNCIKDFKSMNPFLKITTHMIVGFPSETKKEFHETIDFVENSDIDGAQFFAYSKRPNTPAYDRKDKLSNETIQQRMREIVQHFGKDNVDIITAHNFESLSNRFSKATI